MTLIFSKIWFSSNALIGFYNQKPIPLVTTLLRKENYIGHAPTGHQIQTNFRLVPEYKTVKFGENK